MMIETIDELISASLKEFVTDLFTIPWSGCREREAVSLYSFGYLTRHIKKNKFLTCPTQIGMDVAVPQINRAVQSELSGRKGTKDQVCKDVVLWPQPRMTCWDAKGEPTLIPAAILEWKYDEPKMCKYDVGWLTAFSSSYSNFVGYALTVDPQGRNFRLSCTRVQNGMPKENWLLFR